MTRHHADPNRPSSHPARLPLGALACLCLIWGLSGCQKEDHSYPPRQRTKGEARLPPTPDLAPKPPLSEYEDGALSVYGVLTTGARKKDALLTVRGYVAAVHVCAPDKTICKPAPYVQLTDSDKLQGRRLLVGGAIDPARDGLKVGQRADVKGRFATSSADGLYFAPQGLLLFEPPAPPDAEPAEARAKGK